MLRTVPLTLAAASTSRRTRVIKDDAVEIHIGEAACCFVIVVQSKKSWDVNALWTDFHAVTAGGTWDFYILVNDFHNLR